MSDEPIHERLREQAERAGLLESESSELGTRPRTFGGEISRQLQPLCLLVATVVLDLAGVLALLFINIIVAISIFTLSGTLLTVWALMRARESARAAAIEAGERRRAARGEEADGV